MVEATRGNRGMCVGAGTGVASNPIDGRTPPSATCANVSSRAVAMTHPLNLICLCVLWCLDYVAWAVEDILVVSLQTSLEPLSIWPTTGGLTGSHRPASVESSAFSIDSILFPFVVHALGCHDTTNLLCVQGCDGHILKSG